MKKLNFEINENATKEQLLKALKGVSAFMQASEYAVLNHKIGREMCRESV